MVVKRGKQLPEVPAEREKKERDRQRERVSTLNLKTDPGPSQFLLDSVNQQYVILGSGLGSILGSCQLAAPSPGLVSGSGPD